MGTATVPSLRKSYCRNPLEVSFIRRDNNGDGNLTLAEFSIWSKTPEAIAKAKEDFERKDVNQDKSLTIREFTGKTDSNTAK